MSVNYFKHIFDDNTISIIRCDEAGQWWLGMGESDKSYIEWLAEGNMAEKWNPES